MNRQLDDLTTRLRDLDAGAPREGDAAMHQRVHDRLRLDDRGATPLITGPTPSSTPVPAPRRGRYVRRAAMGVAAAAAGVTALTVAQPAEPAMAALTPEALSTWTATAQPAAGALDARDSCLREFGEGISTNPDATYLLEERRGDLTSMIAAYRDQTAFCIVGPDNTGLLNSMSGLDVDVTDRPTDGLTAAVSGDDLDGPEDSRLHYITGRYAPDVQTIDLALADGRQLATSMQDGWFTAWWTGTALTPSTQVTWTTTDARTTSIFAELPY